MDLNIDIVGIICKYIGKKEILNLAKVGKDYYGYIMNEKSIMEKYALKAKERIKNLNFIPKLSYRIFNFSISINDPNPSSVILFLQHLDIFNTLTFFKCFKPLSLIFLHLAMFIISTSSKYFKSSSFTSLFSISILNILYDNLC